MEVIGSMERSLKPLRRKLTPEGNRMGADACYRRESAKL